MMKLLLPCTLLLLASTVDGSLRGDRRKRARLQKDDKKNDKKCNMDCGPAPAAAPSTPSTSPPTPAFKTSTMDVCQETGEWKKDGAVACTSNDMCKDYQTNVGTVCCLAMSCTCGSTADEDAGTDRCGNFRADSSFTNAITVPSIRLPTTEAIEAETAPPSSAPSLPASDDAENAVTDGTTWSDGAVITVPAITVPTNDFDWQA